MRIETLILGFIAGVTSGGGVARKEPVAYLYNGVRLPKLPEWDKTAYPYAAIALSGGEYYLRVSDSAITARADGATGTVWWDDGNTFKVKYGAWTSGACLTTPLVWANHDVYYKDSVEEVGGTLYLAASTPIPVYE